MRKKISCLLIVAHALAFSIPALSVPPSLCEVQFVSVSEQNGHKVAKAAEQNLKKYENIFSRARDLARYKMAFGKEFIRTLREIADRGGHWIDAGAGDAAAIQEFVEENPRVFGTAISIESKAESSDRLTVIKGQFIEDIPNGKVAKGRVVTDLIGGLAYSGTPHLILRQYFDWADANGEIFVFMGTRDVYGLKNRVITADGRYLNLIDWIKGIPGIKVDLLVETREDDGVIYEKWAMRLTRDAGQPLSIPDVVLRELQPGAPPTMLFQEKPSFSARGNNALLEAQLKIRRGIENGLQKKAQSSTFTQFLDSFRGGEITHPLVSEVKNLKLAQRWVNVSPYGANLKQELENRSYDASSDKIFFGVSQRLMRFRVNSIKPERFQYTHVSAGSPLESLKDVGVLTDFYGDFATSLRPDEVLRKYVQAIGDSGTAFIFLGPEYTGFGASSDVLTEKGKRISLRNWLKSIPGLDVKLFRGGYAYAGGQWTFVRIRKTKSSVAIPPLKFLGADIHTDGDVPAMIFQEGVPR
ncbi:MAG: hypothetical protein J0L82_12865 [Deltaproteobacteria bacterium]|nr:hypothetical protein [Deltaproteobacteria bacterium]